MTRTELLAEAAGKIVEIWVYAGQTIPVETVIAMQVVDEAVVNAEADVEEPQQEKAVADPPAENLDDEYEVFPELGDEANPYVEPEIETSAGNSEEAGARYGQVQASPAAIELAFQHNINLESLIGTGSCGQIERADIEVAMLAKSRFITAEDIDDLMNFEGDFTSKLPSDEPTSAPEAEGGFDSRVAGQAEAVQVLESDQSAEEGPPKSLATEGDLSAEDLAPPTAADPEAADETGSSPDVIYMGAGPESADEPEALAIDASDTIDNDVKSDAEFTVKEELNVEFEPLKLDEATIAQIIGQSATQPSRKVGQAAPPGLLARCSRAGRMRRISLLRSLWT